MSVCLRTTSLQQPRVKPRCQTAFSLQMDLISVGMGRTPVIQLHPTFLFRIQRGNKHNGCLCLFVLADSFTNEPVLVKYNCSLSFTAFLKTAYARKKNAVTVTLSATSLRPCVLRLLIVFSVLLLSEKTTKLSSSRPIQLYH